MDLRNLDLKWPLRILIGVTFCLIALGGAVRAMDAGLSCPDWPLCFGKVIPQYEIHVYFEFIHRVIAGIVAISTVTLAVLVFRSYRVPKITRRFFVAALAVLAAQIIFGGLTVLKLLKYWVVTTHLALGMAFFSTLLWGYFVLTHRTEKNIPAKMPKSFLSILVFGALAVYGQILLGGLVSSQYAGVACPEFPLCQGEIAPTFSGPVGAQVIHRLGAYFVLVTMFSLFRVIRATRKAPWMTERIVSLGNRLILLTALQIGVGISNVLYKVPPIITTVHLAIAATMLGTILRIVFLGYARAKDFSPQRVSSIGTVKLAETQPSHSVVSSRLGVESVLD